MIYLKIYVFIGIAFFLFGLLKRESEMKSFHLKAIFFIYCILFTPPRLLYLFIQESTRKL